MDTSNRESLLSKYNIPINYLDYEFLRKCENPTTIEKIIIILKSGEEGYYPDLEKCAEERLKQLKPTSKVLRKEVSMLTKASMDCREWNEVSNVVTDWTNDLKQKHKILRNLNETTQKLVINDGMPPIRQAKSVASDPDSNNQVKKKTIGCDYRKWDKYEPESEILKMDLDDERNRQNTEMMNASKIKNILIEEISSENRVIPNLSSVENEFFANKHRVAGNDFFKSKDYNEAICEYTKSLNFQISANVYNNKAIAYLKLEKYDKTIENCNLCLNLEPGNLKALLRKAQALLNIGNKREALNIFKKIELIDPNCSHAKKNVLILEKELPPENAYRMTITETTDSDKNKTEVTRTIPKTSPVTPTINKTMLNDDLAELIKPNKIIQSKIAKLGATLKDVNTNKNNKKTESKIINKNHKSADADIQIFPKQLDDTWKGAFIEEIN